MKEKYLLDKEEAKVAANIEFAKTSLLYGFSEENPGVIVDGKVVSQEEAACRNHYDKKMIRKDEYDSEDKCLAATVSAIRRCTKAKKLDTDCVAYFFRILDKEWSKLDSDYKYSGKRKDECYACDSLLDIYRTEVVAQAVLCGEGDVILTVEGKHPPPQWFDWLSRPDNKDEEFFDGVTDVLDRTLNIFSDKDNDKGHYDRDGNYYGPADKNKYEQMDGVQHS